MAGLSKAAALASTAGLALAAALSYSPSLTADATTLDIDFTASALPSIVTFTRASPATRFNSSGVLESVGNNVARFDYDPATLQPRGLLIEEQRTNQHLNSTNFTGYGPTTGTVTKTAAYGTAPDGTQTTTRFQVDGTNRTLRFQSNDTGIDATATGYCISVFYRGAFASLVNVSARTGSAVAWTDMGVSGLSGFRRAYAVVTSGAFATSGLIDIVVLANSDFELWGIQVEKNATFPTSYIPTTSAAVARSADVATITGSNFTSWFNASEGTFVAEASILGTTGDDRGIIAVQSASSVGRGLEFDASTARSEGVTRNATSVGVASSFVAALASVHRAALAYTNGGTMSVCSDGGTVATSAATDSVTPTSANIGKQDIGGGRGYLNGHLRRIQFYPMRRTDLQALTA